MNTCLIVIRHSTLTNKLKYRRVLRVSIFKREACYIYMSQGFTEDQDKEKDKDSQDH